MPKVSDLRRNGFHHQRSRYHRAWSTPTGIGDDLYHRSPPTATVHDTRVWKTVMDHLDIHSDILHRQRRDTDKRFVMTTIDDIMAEVTDALDRATTTLAEGSIHLKHSSPDLVRCKMADGIPEELLFSLEDEGEMTIDMSPGSSNDSSTLKGSSSVTSSDTLVAPCDGTEEWGMDGYKSEILSPPMDCEKLQGKGSPGRGDSGSDGRAENQESQRGTWRDAICFRQYHRLNHPKMSWRRAHESLRRRRIWNSRGRYGRDSRLWSPQLNVSWTSIEEEIKKQGLLSSPLNLTTLVSPVYLPMAVDTTNEEETAKDVAKRLQKTDRKSFDVHKTQDRKQGKEIVIPNDRNHKSASQDKQGKQENSALKVKLPSESHHTKDSSTISAACQVGGKRHKNQGNNAAKQTSKNVRCINASAKENVAEANAKLASLMEQYVKAEPFVPKSKPLPKASDSACRRGKDTTITTKIGGKESISRNQNVAQKKRDVLAKEKRTEGKEKDCLKPVQENNEGELRVPKERRGTPKPPNQKAETFRSEQHPIPVIEQGVVHHRHQSPPRTQQTTEGNNRNTGPTVDGDIQATCDNSEKLSSLPDKELSGRLLVVPHPGGQQEVGSAFHTHQMPHQQASGPPLRQEQVMSSIEAGYGRGGAPPGIPAPALWHPRPGTAAAVSAFRHRHPGPGIPPQIPNQVPYINLPLANWTTNRFPNPQHPRQHHPMQGMPNHVQQPFVNGRHPPDQVLPMMHPQQAFVNGRQQEPMPAKQPEQSFGNNQQQGQLQMMQLQQSFLNGRQQDQITQQPFVTGNQQDQIPMMQPAAHGQPQPIVMLEDPCILFAQRNQFPQNGQNNNNTRIRCQPRPQESTNQPQLSLQNAHQLNLQGQHYHRNTQQPFPNIQYQQASNHYSHASQLQQQQHYQQQHQQQH